MSEQLTHWKKLKNPDYLGSWDLDRGDVIVTIAKVTQAEVYNTGKKKNEACVVLHFVENLKPMIVNSTNGKMIEKLSKSKFIEQWIGLKIQIGISQVKVGKEMTDGIRVREYIQQQQPQIDPRLIDEAVINIEAAATLAELQTMYTALDSPIRNHPKVVAAKDKRKSELTPKSNEQ